MITSSNRASTLLLSFVFLAAGLQAQVPTIQDCLGAIPVCQKVYKEEKSPTGDGNYPNEINTNISCTAGELNSIWYLFQVQENGELGFLITPNDLNDDYDWALFDITNADCSQIKNMQSLMVSCNAAGGPPFCNGRTGATGATSLDIQGAGCSNPPTINTGQTPFNDRITMRAGNIYVLMVSNWSGSPNGYTIDFSESTGLGILDESEPEIASVNVPDDCGENYIDIDFTENIKCNTVNNANFKLEGPGGPYTLRMEGGVCVAGGAYDKRFRLRIDPPINELGDYTFSLVTDGATQVLDVCDNPSLPYSASFTIEHALDIQLELGPDTTLLCAGETVVLDATNMLATYRWQDGSTGPMLTVSRSGLYAVTVENDCGVIQDQVEVFYSSQPPVVDLGSDQVLCPGEVTVLDATNTLTTYRWQDGSTAAAYTVSQEGVYSVEAENACGVTTAGVDIDYIEAVRLDLGPDQVLCNGEILELDVTNADVESYRWNDGSTQPIYQVTADGVYAVTITTACEVVSDTINITYIEVPVLELGPDTSICIIDPLTLNVSIPGAAYQWHDGSTASSMQVDATGLYAVTVNTACNALTDAVFITVIDSIQTELGQDTFYCPGSRLFLDAGAGAPAEYLWSTGETTSSIEVNVEGRYSVTVVNQCEFVEDEIEIQACEICTFYFPNAFSPNGDGINDSFRPFPNCTVINYEMKVFDRWGTQLFSSTDHEQGWNGQLNGQEMDMGVYVWVMKYTVSENGTPRSATLTGEVAVVR